MIQRIPAILERMCYEPLDFPRMDLTELKSNVAPKRFTLDDSISIELIKKYNAQSRAFNA